MVKLLNIRNQSCEVNITQYPPASSVQHGKMAVLAPNVKTIVSRDTQLRSICETSPYRTYVLLLRLPYQWAFKLLMTRTPSYAIRVIVIYTRIKFLYEHILGY